MSPDLQGESLEMKLALEHIELVEKGDGSKVREEEDGDGGGGKPPCKCRVTQSVAALKDAKRKENISQQEQRWIELTQGQQGSRASASISVPTEMATTSTVTSTISSTVTSVGRTTTMAVATVSSTVEIEQEVDLQAAMHSQGDDDDDTYGRKYKTMSKDRTDRGVAHAKQKEEHERQERE